MSNEHKTRAERIEEAARVLCEHYKTNRHYGPTWCVRDLREVLALPPDPPRGDGWEALRELLKWIDGPVPLDALLLRKKILKLLAAATKEPEPAESPAEPAQDDEDAISSVSAKTFDVASENETALWVRRIWHELARRLAREKADLRAKLAASDEILAEVRVEADGLMRALRRIAKLGKGGA